MKSKRNKISIMARKKKVKEEIKRIMIIWSRIDEKKIAYLDDDVARYLDALHSKIDAESIE